MVRRLIIIDSAFSRGEGHHLAANELLGKAALESGFDEVKVLCQKQSPLDNLADGAIDLVRVLETTPYATFRVGDLDRLSQLNNNAYQDFQAVPEDIIQDGDMVLVHTINEVQFAGMAKWLSELLATKDIRLRLAMMFPAGLDFDDDKVLGLRDPDAAMIFQRSAELLQPYADKVEWMGIGRNIAREFSLLLGTRVAYAPALVPNIGKRLDGKPTFDVPNILLYVGDAKFDKGYHYLPALIKHLRGLDQEFLATVQVSGAIVGNYPEFRKALVDAVQGDSRFNVVYDRLSNETYENIWQTGHIVLLGYDPSVYKYKSSGLCWEAMNYSVPAVVVSDTFHHRELVSYGHEPVVVNEYWPDALFEGLKEALASVREMGEIWHKARDGFVATNQPELYFSEELQGCEGSGAALDLEPFIPAWRRQAFDVFFS